MGRSNENKKIAKHKAKKLTTNQLKRWGVLYHKIEFGKPSYDLFIDDKAYGFDIKWPIHITKKFINNCSQTKKI